MLDAGALVLRSRHFVSSGLKTWMGRLLGRSFAISEARTIFAKPFDHEHHILATLAQYDENPRLNFRETPLYDFLKNFNPRDTVDALLGDAATDELPLFEYPWGPISGRANAAPKDPWTSRFCGPSTDEFVEAEFNRTIELYRNLRQGGYRPTRYPNSFVGGTWLIRTNGERRYVVLQGNHRVAVLCHLGFARLAYWPVKGVPSVVREGNLEFWPPVRSGRCSTKTAARIFDAFFLDAGNTTPLGSRTGLPAHDA